MIFLKILFICLDRGEGREEERERNIDVQVIHGLVASHTPPTGDLAHNPGMCPDQESNQWPFGSQAGTQSTKPHQPGPAELLMTMWVNKTSWNVKDFLIKDIIPSCNNITHCSTPLHLIMPLLLPFGTEEKWNPICTSTQSPQWLCGFCSDIHHFVLRVGIFSVFNVILCLNLKPCSRLWQQQQNSLWPNKYGTFCVVHVSRVEYCAGYQSQESKSPCTTYQSQERSPIVSWYQSPHGKQDSQALDRTTLYLHREETEQDQLQ